MPKGRVDKIDLQPAGPAPTTCALCLQDKPLRDSHIVPEFVYESIYDDKHRFHTVGVGQYPAYEQKGLREPRLCNDCETKLSVWEGYGRSVFAGSASLRFEQEGTLTWVQGLDYAPFKLFLMSILWRAGVARGPFWERVSLGPHAERLRQMLSLKDPGRPEQYGCYAWRIRLKADPATFILQPTTTRVGTVRGYRFTLAACFWAYTVGSHADRSPLRAALLQTSGRMALGAANDIGEAEFFQAIVQRMKERPRTA